MARQALPIVGAVIGYIVGGASGARWGWMIGSVVGGIVDPQVIKGPRIGDVGVQTSRDGVPRPIVYGTAPVVGNIIDRGEYVKTIHSESQSKGGPVVETERISLTFAIRVCEGPIAAITRIWEDEKLVYDTTPDSMIIGDTLQFADKIEIYLGTETQMPDPSLEAIHGVGTTPAYRGSAYVVFKDKDLTDRRGSIASYRFEVATNADIAPNEVSPEWFIGNTSVGGYYSEEGDDFNVTTYRSVPNVVNHGSAFFLDGKVISQGSTQVCYSTDAGITWSPEFSMSPVTVAGQGGEMAFSGGNYYTVGGGNYVGKSGNLETWTIPLASPDARGTTLAMKGARLVIHNGGSSKYSYYSDDGGLSYTASTNWILGVNEFTDGKGVLRANDSRFIAFVREGSPNYTKRILHGSSGDLWIDSGFSFPSNTAMDGPLDMCFASVIARWVAITAAGDIAWSDNNGESWHISLYVATNPNRIASDGLKFLIVCEDGVIISSTNGDDWSVVPGPGSTIDIKRIVPLGESTTLPVVTPGKSILYYIVGDLCNRNGVLDSEIDVSELTDVVDGFVVGGVYSAGECIRSLQRVYFFDSGEWDAVLHFPKRGGAIVATITEDDLVEEPEEATREQELEFPRKMHLSYQNASLGYAPTKVTVSRSSPDIRVVGEVTVEVPVVLDVDQAAQVNDKLMKVAWVDTGGERKFKLPDNWSFLTATDCVNVNFRGRTTRVRIERIDNADGIIDIQARHDRQSSYQSAAVGEAPPDPLDPVSSVPGDTYFEFMNIPALTDADDRLGYYVAVRGELEPWQGASIERSIDAGASFVSALNTDINARMGTLLDPLPGASEYCLDTTNQIRFQMYGPDTADMPSITYTQLLQQGNACLVGNEIIQYQDAVEESPGVWVLSTLLRGRLATPSVDLDAGERFVFLSGASFVEVSSSLISASLTHRATSFGNSSEDSDEFTDLYEPAHSQLEFAPCYLTLTRSLADVITATWTPRYRFGSAIAPIQSVNDRGFRITFYDGVTSVTLPDQTWPAASYDASAMSGPVTVTVQPINRITGKTGPNVSGVV